MIGINIIERGKRVRLVVILIATLCISNSSQCQSELAGLQQASLDQWFDSQVAVENSPLIDGKEYLPRLIGKISDPFLTRREPFKGVIEYGGQTYHNVLFIYDVFQDILVLSHNQNNSVPILMEMDQEKVFSFELEGRAFEKIAVEDSIALEVSSGYFEILMASNRSRFISKRIKVDYLYNARREFKDRHLYFIENAQGELISIKYKSDFFDLYPDRVSEMKGFIKQERLKVKPWNEQDLLQLYKYCTETLVSQ